MEGFCRGCLVKYNEPTELLHYTEKNRRLFVYSTGLQVKRNDSIAFQLCKDCYVNMKWSCKFKKQCRTSDKRLKQYLSLKEAGDVTDFCTFIKNTEDLLKFPLLSGHSTPAYQKTRDDDNESTCTSIRNFMSDMLQGEEVPYTEAQIIKEVIEEAADVLDDSLDSHWLQDDVSIDTDFRLDFSFSPFSTPRAGNNDRCLTPQKTIDSLKPSYNNTVKNKIDHLLMEKNDHEKHNLIEQVFVSPIRIKPIKDMLNIAEANNESQNSFGDLIDQTINLFTQNENDIEIQPVSPIVDNENVQTVKNTLLHSETEIAVKHIDLINARNNSNLGVLTEDKSISKKNISDLNYVDNNDISCMIQKETDLAVKYIESNNLPEDLKVESVHDSDVDLDIEEVKPNIYVISSNQNEEDIEINQSNPNQDINITRKNFYVENAETNKNEDNHEILYDLKGLSEPSAISNESDGKNQSDKSSINENIEKVLDDTDSKDFSLGDLLLSPAEYAPAAGASTPMINNILFGKKLELDENTNQSQVSDKMDVLDQILKQGVKEFGMDIEDKYDLEKCYCKVCDKKFQTIKALKIHLTKNHKIKLPKTKTRAFDKRERVCDICGATFNDFANFQRHVKRHEKTGIKCNVCKLVFASEAKLKVHSASHQGMQPLEVKNTKKCICNVCGVTLTTRSNFAVHMRRHNKEFIVFCDECGKGFFRTTDLAIHKRQHSGEKPFPCEYCDQSFSRRYNLIKHMKNHLEDDIPEELMRALGNEGEDVEIAGEELQIQLVNRWTNIIQNGLGKEVKDTLIKKYPTPINFPSSVPPKMNPEMAASHSEATVKRDRRIINRQMLMGKLMIALGRALSSVLKGNLNTKTIVEQLNDSAKLAAELYYQDSASRKFFALAGTSTIVKDAVKNVKTDEYLFGTNCGELIKAAQALQRTATQIKLSSNKPRTPGNWKSPLQPSLQYRSGQQYRPPARTRPIHQTQKTHPSPINQPILRSQTARKKPTQPQKPGQSRHRRY